MWSIFLCPLQEKRKSKIFWSHNLSKIEMASLLKWLLKLWPCFEFSFDYLTQHISSGQAVIYLKGLVNQKFTFFMSGYFCFFGSCFSIHFSFHLNLISYAICLSLSDLLPMVWSSPNPPVLFQVTLLYSFFYGKQYSFVYMYHILMHSSANGQFGGFHVLAIQSSVAVAFRFMCLSP